MSPDNAKELCRRGDALFGKKKVLDTFWQEVADQFYPERADFTTPHSWGEEFGADLFDSTPLICRRDLGNAFSSMLRPRGQPWFKCVDPDEKLMEQPRIAAWYDHLTARGRQFLYNSRSGFVRATKEGDHDFAAFGNGVLSGEVRRSGDGLLFRCHHLRDCAWAESSEGFVDTMFRNTRMSARQIRQMFGAKNARQEGENGFHQDIKNALEKNPDQEFDVWHVMMPADDYEGKPKGKAMEWVSIYIDKTHNRFLREAWSYEFRYVVPRWQTISGSPYAVSPAVTVGLADARGMQTMARVLLEAGEKAVDPPMKVKQEKIRGDINLYSGGVTIVEADYDERMGAILEPLINGRHDVNLGVQLLLRAAGQQRDAWFLNKLNLPHGAKTAYETSQLVEEYVRAAIPLFEPMETEYNEPILNLAYAILTRERAFNFQEMPPELEGRDYEFSFSNPLQDAIERNKVNQATTIFGAVAAAVQINPETAKTIDTTRIVRDVTRGTGAPATWLVDEQVQAEAAQAAAEDAEVQQGVGDILTGLAGAKEAAGVVREGAEATAALQQVGLVPGPAEVLQ